MNVKNKDGALIWEMLLRTTKRQRFAFRINSLKTYIGKVIINVKTKIMEKSERFLFLSQLIDKD